MRWRIAEIHLAFREFDRKKKGFLNSTELRRLLVNFGVAWSMVHRERSGLQWRDPGNRQEQPLMSPLLQFKEHLTAKELSMFNLQERCVLFLFRFRLED